MEIVIDFAQIGSNPLAFAWWFFKTIGWIIPVFLFIAALLKFWQAHIRNLYRKERKYILLAIDVPRNNEQTPKAVENIFNHLAGAHQPIGFLDDWWTGEIKNSFSFEIISIGGYIQFIIHLCEQYRDLVEATIYAQYPEAEIVEIEDYTAPYANLKFPNDQYQLWGSQLKLAKKEFYPIRTYEEFEDKVSKEAYKDSMAGLLEAMTRIGPGEQIWVQVVATPADNDWGHGGETLVKKLIGAKSEGGSKGITGMIEGSVGYVASSILSPAGGESGGHSGGDAPNKMMHLTPGEKDTVAAVERKISKIGFHTRIRLIYLAEKDKFKKPIGGAIYGAFKQFNTNDLNSFKPSKRYLTGSIFYFKNMRLEWRRKKILYLYRNRGHWLEAGTYGEILNTEELATVWHFPIFTVKAPLVQKTEAKTAEPPITLPVADGPHLPRPVNEIRRPTPASQPITPTTAPPENLPTA